MLEHLERIFMEMDFNETSRCMLFSVKLARVLISQGSGAENMVLIMDLLHNNTLPSRSTSFQLQLVKVKIDISSDATRVIPILNIFGSIMFNTRREKLVV